MTKQRNKKGYEEAKEILRIYAETEPEDALDKRVRQWLVSDFHKEEKEAALQELWEELPPGDEKGKTAAWKAIRLKVGWVNPERKRKIRVRLMQVAAVMIPALFVAGLYLVIQNHEKNRVVAELEHTLVITGEEMQRLLLADGTEVHLNQQTTFRYNKARKNYLEGEAFFHVQQAPEDFVLETPQVKITVLGTQFNVRNYPQEDDIRISLYEGRLQLETADTLLVMTGGDELIFSPLLGWHKHTTERSAPAWSMGRVIYENKLLRDVFPDLERRYAVRIEVDNADLLEEVLTLKFENGTPLDEVLFLISQVKGVFNYRVAGDTVKIRMKKGDESR